VVVALMFTLSSGMPRSIARLFRMAGMWGASFGAWATMMESMLLTESPFSLNFVTTILSRLRLDMPL
jgi:hypothetical protein